MREGGEGRRGRFGICERARFGRQGRRRARRIADAEVRRGALFSEARRAQYGFRLPAVTAGAGFAPGGGSDAGGFGSGNRLSEAGKASTRAALEHLDGLSVHV